MWRKGLGVQVNDAFQHTSHVTRHTSHATRHTSHVTSTSHVTRHTPHLTRHTSHSPLSLQMQHVVDGTVSISLDSEGGSNGDSLGLRPPWRAKTEGGGVVFVGSPGMICLWFGSLQPPPPPPPSPTTTSSSPSVSPCNHQAPPTPARKVTAAWLCCNH